MQKIKQAIYWMSSAALMAPMVVSAQWVDPSSSPVRTNSGLDDTTIYGVITFLMQWLLIILAVVAVIAFVISGIMYLTAAGDETRVEKAKNAMIYSIVGVLVGLIGLIIINAIDAWLGGSTTF